MNTQLNQKEQQVLVMEIVDACIKYSKIGRASCRERVCLSV